MNDDWGIYSARKKKDERAWAWAWGGAGPVKWDLTEDREH